jgi:aminoglycoside phosphotransferase (APT) family kinase protein
MSKPYDIIPSQEVVRRVLDILEPGCTHVKIETPPGSFSNYTHVVDARRFDARTRQGADFKLVIRRNKLFCDYDQGEKARREFKTMELLRTYGIPAPRPLLLDTTGELLEIPGFVMEFVPGAPVYEFADPVRWVHTLAKTLAKIHSIPCNPETQEYLLDADSEASWFLRYDPPPDYMLKHPDGERIWHAVRELYPKRERVSGGLVHIDFWAGNILWQGNRIVAIVDWEEAAFGDTAYDVAYARLDITMLGYGHVADELLRVYEDEMGCPAKNLGLWELAAAVRPLFGWGDEIYKSPAKERLEGFLAQAIKRVGIKK